MPTHRTVAKPGKIAIIRRILAENIDWRDLWLSVVIEITEFYFKSGLFISFFLAYLGAPHNIRLLLIGSAVAAALWIIDFIYLMVMCGDD